MNNPFMKKALRRWIIRCAASVVVLAALMGTGYGIANLALQLPQPLQGTFLYIAGAIGLPIVYLAGILVERIAVRSWDTWLGDLGPTEISVLTEAMIKRQAHLEDE